MNQEQIDEYKKCLDDPYYFHTTYITIKGDNGKSFPFSTTLSRESFNEFFNKMGDKTIINKKFNTK